MDFSNQSKNNWKVDFLIHMANEGISSFHLRVFQSGTFGLRGLFVTLLFLYDKGSRKIKSRGTIYRHKNAHDETGLHIYAQQWIR